MTRTGVAVALLLISIVTTAPHRLSADAASRQISLTAPAAAERVGQRLKPGLKVEYIHRFVRHIDEIVADHLVRRPERTHAAARLQHDHADLQPVLRVQPQRDLLQLLQQRRAKA